jgi:hypothetical protein
MRRHDEAPVADLEMAPVSLARHRRHWDTQMIEVPAAARQARIPPRNRPVLLEQLLPVVQGHSLSCTVLFLHAREDPASRSLFVLQNIQPLPMVLIVAMALAVGRGVARTQ